MEIHEQVEKATDQLRVINAEASVHENFELVSKLVGKLQHDHQQEWDRHVVESPDQSTPS